MSQEQTGALLALGLIGVVLTLSGWLWVERRSRVAVSSEEDQAHFFNQDVRRGVVLVVLSVLAGGLYLGSRMPTRVRGRPNLLFVETWLGIFALVLTLIALAFLDWLATRRYAKRQRSAIIEEGITILRDEIEVRRSLREQDRPGGGQNGAARP